MAQIIGHNSSHSAWNALEKTFSSSSRARIMQLRLELQSTKEGSLSMIDYVMKVITVNVITMLECYSKGSYLEIWNVITIHMLCFSWLLQ